MGRSSFLCDILSGDDNPVTGQFHLGGEIPAVDQAILHGHGPVLREDFGVLRFITGATDLRTSWVDESP